MYMINNDFISYFLTYFFLSICSLHTYQKEEIN